MSRLLLDTSRYITALAVKVSGPAYIVTNTMHHQQNCSHLCAHRRHATLSPAAGSTDTMIENEGRGGNFGQERNLLVENQ